MSDPIAALVLVGVCALSYACGARAPLRNGAIAVGALLLVLVFAAGGSFVPYVLATIGPWGAARLVRSRRELVDVLAERTSELEAERDDFARLAVKRERARIARELHDIVSHHLAVIVVQAGAGRLASPGHPDSMERLSSIRQSGDEALAEMTRLVNLLQSDDRGGEPERGTLQLLLDQARTAGLKLESAPLPAEVRLSPEVEWAAYRVVQEGLTNSMKHAPGSDVNLRFAVRAGELEVDLRDRGGGAPTLIATTGAGLGLTGMRERLESLGGSLEAGPQAGGGWRLLARLPTG